MLYAVYFTNTLVKLQHTVNKLELYYKKYKK